MAQLTTILYPIAFTALIYYFILAIIFSIKFKLNDAKTKNKGFTVRERQIINEKYRDELIPYMGVFSIIGILFSLTVGTIVRNFFL